jgi:hypothetical protein
VLNKPYPESEVVSGFLPVTFSLADTKFIAAFIAGTKRLKTVRKPSRFVYLRNGQLSSRFDDEFPSDDV